MIRRAKIIVLVLIPLLMMIFILQNTQDVDTTLLFVTASMSLAALLLVTLLIGFVLGVLAGTSFTRQPPKG